MNKMKLFTSNEIKPKGWLKRQLEIQANGLSGNLDKVWPDVRDSAWIGGKCEGWERVPYWLDGFIPLAYLLEDEDMIARAKKYIDSIISSQRSDGWICPCADDKRAEYDTWAVQLITKTLKVYYDCSGDERIPKVIYRVMKNYYQLLKTEQIKLFEWGKFRWYESFIALNFLDERYNESWIKELARILREQGANYNDYTECWKKEVDRWTFETHIVNLAMMLKSEAVSCDLLGESYTDNAQKLYDVLSEYNSTPVELFTGDECLGGLSPIHGTELCAVVEQMYSYELLYAYTGDKKWAEKLEIIAFNALPATISDDMWTHQYDQMSNQIACQKFPNSDKVPFTTNGVEAHLFGLEPNYGCCTANFNQGWPKLALSAFMHSGDTVVNALMIPCELDFDGRHILVETDYPFKNEVKYTVCSNRDFVFKVRVPSFAEKLTVNGEEMRSDMLTFEIKAGDEREIVLNFDASPYFKSRSHGLSTVQCGSLVFSVPISFEKNMLEFERDSVERKFPYCDYELIPTSDFGYAYCGKKLEVTRREVDEIPFSSKNPPVIIDTKVQKIDWGLEDGFDTVCAKVPQSLEPISGEMDMELYPYGCAKLRMTEIPVID